MKELCWKYFITQDHNCAESTLLVANELYHMDLTEEEIKLVSAFGAGMGCEGTCGALCAALAAIGKLNVKDRAHATEGFGDLCGGFVRKFERDLGSTDCVELKKRYRNDAVRCLKTVELTVQAMDEYLKSLPGRADQA